MLDADFKVRSKKSTLIEQLFNEQERVAVLFIACGAVYLHSALLLPNTTLYP